MCEPYLELDLNKLFKKQEDISQTTGNVNTKWIFDYKKELILIGYNNGIVITLEKVLNF